MAVSGAGFETPASLHLVTFRKEQGFVPVIIHSEYGSYTSGSGALRLQPLDQRFEALHKALYKLRTLLLKPLIYQLEPLEYHHSGFEPRPFDHKSNALSTELTGQINRNRRQQKGLSG